MTHRLLRLTPLALVPACVAPFAEPVQTAEDGRRPTVVVESTPDCTAGGTRLSFGLDDGETDTAIVCDGADGAAGGEGLAVVVTSDEACAPAAGARVEVRRGDTLVSSSVVCAGDDLAAEAPLRIETAPSTDPGCTRVSVGFDGDDDGDIDTVLQVADICRGPEGATGATGGAGEALVSASIRLPVGDAACSGGGERVTFGLDTDGDGDIDGAPVASITVCDGVDSDGAGAGFGEDQGTDVPVPLPVGRLDGAGAPTVATVGQGGSSRYAFVATTAARPIVHTIALHGDTADLTPTLLDDSGATVPLRCVVDAGIGVLCATPPLAPVVHTFTIGEPGARGRAFGLTVSVGADPDPGTLPATLQDGAVVVARGGSVFSATATLPLGVHTFALRDVVGDAAFQLIILDDAGDVIDTCGLPCRRGLSAGTHDLIVREVAGGGVDARLSLQTADFTPLLFDTPITVDVTDDEPLYFRFTPPQDGDFVIGAAHPAAPHLPVAVQTGDAPEDGLVCENAGCALPYVVATPPIVKVTPAQRGPLVVAAEPGQATVDVPVEVAAGPVFIAGVDFDGSAVFMTPAGPAQRYTAIFAPRVPSAGYMEATFAADPALGRLTVTTSSSANADDGRFVLPLGLLSAGVTVDVSIYENWTGDGNIHGELEIVVGDDDVPTLDLTSAPVIAVPPFQSKRVRVQPGFGARAVALDPLEGFVHSFFDTGHNSYLFFNPEVSSCFIGQRDPCVMREVLPDPGGYVMVHNRSAVATSVVQLREATTTTLPLTLGEARQIFIENDGGRFFTFENPVEQPLSLTVQASVANSSLRITATHPDLPVHAQNVSVTGTRVQPLFGGNAMPAGPYALQVVSTTRDTTLTLTVAPP
jgi:hypothetical protein